MGHEQFKGEERGPEEGDSRLLVNKVGGTLISSLVRSVTGLGLGHLCGDGTGFDWSLQEGYGRDD